MLNSILILGTSLGGHHSEDASNFEALVQNLERHRKNLMVVMQQFNGGNATNSMVG